VRYPSGHELPPEQEEAWNKAIRLEVFSAIYWASAIVVVYFTLGQSQAMKAAWVEDILGLFPPITFLIAARFRHRPPDRRFPWGYHRAITVAYVVSTAALFALGLFLLIDSTVKLLEGTHPPIGMVEIFDGQIWLGWLMIGALLYSGIPPIILGRLKRPLADELHDKVLFADAKMNVADWLTASAALVGVIGIGFGLWWADAAAAIAISIDILHDGVKYLRQSIADLMDDSPRTYDEEAPHPLLGKVRKEVAATPWVKEGAVRLREEGHMLTGEVLVVPENSQQLLARVEALTERLRELDWQMKDIVVAPVSEIEGAPAGIRVKPEKGSRRG
jgi:cation diffusion facilitator family transporter